MNHPILVGRLLLAALAFAFSAAPAFARVVGRLYALTQATVKIEVTGGPIIYIDPTGINTTPADADFILLTHNHGDHQSTAVMTRLRKASTVFVSSPPGVPALQTAFAGATIHAVTPGTKLTLGGIEIETVPMYNVVKNNHPRAMNFVGYVLNIGGVRVDHAGDTERFPEMKTFSCDVAMLPLGQVFTMARDDPHRNALLTDVIGGNARRLCESSLDAQGLLYTPTCFLLAALSRRLQFPVRREHWKAAIENVVQLHARLARMRPDLTLGLSVGRPSSLFKELTCEALRNAGLLAQPTILDEKNRKLALGVALNRALRFLLAYSLEASECRPSGPQSRDLAWLRMKLEPLVAPGAL
jgi:hypothetical protein